MIFCTVGSQLPFDRLIGYLYTWISNNPCDSVIVQSGLSALPSHVSTCYQFLEEPTFSRFFIESKLVVSHAGMGNIIRAIEDDIPIVIVPRLKKFGEHVNNHQLDTANSFSGIPNIFVANDQTSFDSSISNALSYTRRSVTHKADSLEQLRRSIRAFIQE